MKISFRNDYSEGCHPNILSALAQNNLDQQDGYGHDVYSKEASSIILKLCESPHTAVHFVSGGTQANLLVAAAALRPYESIIAASTGHIATNETGAIEATGHKVSTVKTTEGKLTPAHIQEILDEHNKQPHQLKPKMVYISNATELGTIYSKKELEALSIFCKKNELYLFMDGARLGQALMASTNDLTLKDIADLTDIFYLGGTKNGALIGEAIVISNATLQIDFDYSKKQRGAMLSKGRLLGMQFKELLKENIYFDLAKHANDQAMKIKKALVDAGCNFLVETFTNQIFPILSKEQIEKLSENFDFYVWQKIDEEKAAVRIITSWATPDRDIASFINAIKKI